MQIEERMKIRAVRIHSARFAQRVCCLLLTCVSISASGIRAIRFPLKAKKLSRRNILLFDLAERRRWISIPIATQQL